MVEAQTVEECVEPLAERAAGRSGCELVHCEFVSEARGWVLRLFIDTAEGVTLEECSAVSRELSTMLDVEDIIPHAYHLEVSSPGLDRRLKLPRDFERFRGQAVKIRTTAPVDGRRKFSGTMERLENDAVTLRDAQGQIFEIDLDRVRIARLDPKT